jgi:hypothetical protein
MSGPEKDIDVRTEMRIALWWRNLISDYEYTKFDPDDMLRWYVALELRGPLEIRELLTERYMGRPLKNVVGIVSLAPHPPLWLVQAWLEDHEQKVHTGKAVPWGLAGSFVVLSLIFIPNLQGCANLQPSNPLVMNPPQSAALVTPYTPVVISYAVAPTNNPVSTNLPTIAPPSSAPGATSPISSGIAGAASGAVAPTGSTGATNSGISSSTSQP